MRSVALFVLLLFVCTVGSAQSTPAMTQDEFLASLRSPEPTDMARGQLKQTCTVTLHCAVGGYYLSCTSGVGDCQSGPTWVKCDGVQQNCPICYKAVDCGCECGILDCFGWSSCSSGARRVTCDGVTDYCGPIRACCPIYP